MRGWRKSIGSNGEVFAAFMCGKRVVEPDIEDETGLFTATELDTSKFRLPYKRTLQKSIFKTAPSLKPG